MAAPQAKPYPRIIMTTASSMDPAAGAAADSPASSTGQQPDGIAAHRHLRFRRRRADRGALHHRPAAQRVHPVRRRHRPRPLRPAAHRRGPGQRPGRDGRAGGFRRQAADHRLQLRLRRRAAGRPRTVHRPLRDPRDRGDPAGRPPRRRRHPQRPGGRHRHLRHRRLPRLRGHLRRRPGPGTSPPWPARRSCSYVEAGITTGPELLAVARGVPRAAEGRRRGHRGARLHALPAAHRRHLLRHGGGRHPGVQRRGNRQGRLPRPGLPRPAAAPTPPRPSTTSSPPATPRSSRPWPAASWAPRSSASGTWTTWPPSTPPAAWPGSRRR